MTRLSWLIAACLPFVLVGDALIVLLTPWFVDFQYALPFLPDDPFGLAGEERRELAVAGIESVRPIGPGSGALTQARLPNGAEAFGPSEVTHMADVRGLMSWVLGLWAAALVAGGLAVWRFRERGAELRLGLARGALGTVVALAVLGLLMLVSFEAFFDGFHAVFFEGDSWRFGDETTLRRVYPDEFWAVATASMVGLILLQAAGAWAYATSFFTRRTR